LPPSGCPAPEYGLRTIAGLDNIAPHSDPPGGAAVFMDWRAKHRGALEFCPTGRNKLANNLKTRMKKSFNIAFLTGSLALFISAFPVAAADNDGFVSLFNGKDFSGWTMGPDKSWVIENGVIALKRDKYDGKEYNADYLWTVDQYANFILELEFKIPEQANSGVFLRTPDLSDPVYTGIEVQVANSHGRTNLNRGGTAGAIYDLLAPSANPVKAPGEWNHYRITCDKNKILVVLNGQQIIDMDLDQWTEPHKNPDGSKNKFGTALKDFARKGHIGFQDHGRPVWYRNIRVKKLAD
jgi:hypothetical protein